MRVFHLFVSMFAMGLGHAAFAATEPIPPVSLYLGEVKTLEISESAITLNAVESWEVEHNLGRLDAGELISVQPQMLEKLGKVQVRIAAPYISPSFKSEPVLVRGLTEEGVSVVEYKLSLTVRPELVIKFRYMTEAAKATSLGSRQFDSKFEWDVPRNPVTGDYMPITVNNHERGIWVRFLFDEPEETKLQRDGGYIIHIYRGEGEYIKHQSFNSDTHLLHNRCAFQPLTEEELDNPAVALDAKGKDWKNCEFRGFVPEGMSYGFGYREHYKESELHEKLVEIKNVGELNTDLIEYYKFLDESGMGDPLEVMCSQW